MSKAYETIIVLNAHLSQEQLDANIEKFLQVIKKQEGDIKLVDRWGKRRLAYEIAKKQLRDPELFLVAEDNKRITAAVLGGFDGRRGIVYHLAVREEYRDRGLGDELMTELEKRWKKLGCIRSYLLITPGNLIARQFYDNRNWEKQDLLIMAKDL